jgi:Clp amino terminal domain, pathogenicity island component
MFERFTEKARRVIFFARCEASQYGSSTIETEHLLIGLLRVDWPLVKRFLGPTTNAVDIRTNIEQRITRRECISTSVEVPLANECKTVLTRAAEEAERLFQKFVGTEHILLGILRAEGSLAEQILREKGLRPEILREQLAKSHDPISLREPVEPSKRAKAIARLHNFLAELKWYDWERLAPFLGQNAQFVDASGKRWIGIEELKKQFEVLFAPYVKTNVTCLLEDTYLGPSEFVMASILWENVTFRGETNRSMQRMSVILAQEGEDWVIFLLQVTRIVVD